MSLSTPHATCCPTSETIVDFLSDRLNAVEDSQVASHLEECLACRGQVEHRLSLEHWATPDVDRAWAIPPAFKEQLYKIATDAQSSIDTPAGDDQSAPRHPAEDPQRVGRFLIVRRLGAGGFGVVLLAHDPILNRHVALKLPRLPRFLDTAQQSRFYREAQAAAGLHHPNIVPVHEAGEADGLHYLAADYCPGPTLAAWMARQPGPIEAQTAADIVLHLTQAVEHAHQQGVVHRDIKPGNVLLDPRGHAGWDTGKPHAPREALEVEADVEVETSAALRGFYHTERDDYHAPVGGALPFTPKLTDFGLAKLLYSHSNASHSGQLVGTPRYMAPEQVTGERGAVGPRSDVYSLGVILYELLTGRPPIRGADQADTLRRLLCDEPLAPRRLVATIPRDLESICLKCLEKQVGRRYPSAGALADDLQRFLKGESTQARPFRWHERLCRTARRDPALTALAATIVIAAGLLIGGLLLHNIRLNEALKATALAQEHNENTTYAINMASAHKAQQVGDVQQAARLLANYDAKKNQPDRRGFEWYYLHRLLEPQHLEITAHKGDIYQVRYAPDGRQLATCGKDGFVRLWDAATLAMVREFPAEQGEVNGVSYSPDARFIATTGDDGSISIWDAQTGQRRQRVERAHDGAKTYQTIFFRQGTFLASCAENDGVRLWNAADLKPLARLDSGPVEALALAGDGRLLATAGYPPQRQVGVWNLEEFDEREEQRNAARSVHLLSGHQHTISSVSFSPTGQLLASADKEGRIRLWDVQLGKLRHELKSLNPIHALEFSPNGNHLAVASRGGMIQLWPTSGEGTGGGSYRPDASWQAHDGRAWTLAYSADGRQLASGGVDGKLKLWRRENTIASRAVSGGMNHACQIPGTTQVIYTHSGGVTLCDLEAGDAHRLPDREQAAWDRVAVSGDGMMVAAVPYVQTCMGLWKLPQCEQTARWPLPADLQVYQIALSRDGNVLAAITDSERTPNRLRLFNAQQGNELAAAEAHFAVAAACSPTEPLVAYNNGPNIVLSTMPALLRIGELRGHTGNVRFLAFSQDGQLLASAGQDRLVKIWNVATNKLLHTLDGHASLEVVAFSPDRKTLISGATQAPLQLWNVATGKRLFEINVALSGAAQLIDPWRLAFRRDDGVLAVLDVRRVGGSEAMPGVEATEAARSLPAGLASFSRAGNHTVNVDQGNTECEQLTLSQGAVDLQLYRDGLVRGGHATPLSSSVEVSQPNAAGLGALLRILGPGRLVSRGNATIGELPQSAGRIVASSVADGKDAAEWVIDGELFVGKFGAGMLRIERGASVSDTSAYVAGTWDTSGGRGDVTVTGAGSAWNHASGLHVGFAGAGTLQVERGGSVTSTYGYLGLKAGQATATIRDNGSQWIISQELFVGYSGRGEMHLRDGGVVKTAGDASIAWGTASVEGSGSRWTGSENLYIGGRAGGAEHTGVLTIAKGGRVEVAGNAQLWQTGRITIDSDAVFLAAGVLSNSGVIEIASGGQAHAGTIHNGPGVIRNDGLLRGDVMTPGDLRGTGRFAGTVTIGNGHLSPGSDGPGTVRGDNFVLAAGGVLHCEIQQAIGRAGEDWDLIELDGTLRITNTAEQPFSINLYSMPAGTLGPLANFDAQRAYSWELIRAAGGITGFAPERFSVRQTAFSNPVEKGEFSVRQQGQSLWLDFTPAAGPSP